MSTRAPESLKWEIEDAMRRRDWSRIYHLTDAGLRHRVGSEPVHYLRHWCNIARIFAYATPDYSWGEFEKELGIIIRNVAKYRVICDLAEECLKASDSGDASLFRATFLEILKVAEVAREPTELNKIRTEDKNPISIEVGVDRSNQTVVISFGKPLQYAGLTPETAEELAHILTERATIARQNKSSESP